MVVSHQVLFGPETEYSEKVTDAFNHLDISQGTYFHFLIENGVLFANDNSANINITT